MNPTNSSNTSFAEFPEEVRPIWPPIWLGVITVAALITNGSTLLTFLKNRHLLTPFNVYLVNLASANFINALLGNPPEIINSSNAKWPLSQEYCSFYLFATWILSGGVYNSHLLITVDRLWAVMFPDKYRMMRTVKTCVIACIVMWCYVIALILPELIIDQVINWKARREGYCYVDTSKQSAVHRRDVYDDNLINCNNVSKVLTWDKKKRKSWKILLCWKHNAWLNRCALDGRTLRWSKGSW